MTSFYPPIRSEAQRAVSSTPLSYYGAGSKRSRSVSALLKNPERERAWMIRQHITKALEESRSARDVLDILEDSLHEFDTFHNILAVHRLARHGRSDPRPVVSHASWSKLLPCLRVSLEEGEPRQLASTAWAFATLRTTESDILRHIASRCVSRAGAKWDPMSTSLVLWSFAVLRIEHAELLNMVSCAVRQEGSLVWSPGDVSRVCWSWAKLAHKDGGLFRSASLQVVSKISEFSPPMLTQTLWAFATSAPADASAHLFPRAVQEMETSGVSEYTPQHLAMAVWAFGAILTRPEELLTQIGISISDRVDRLNSQDISMIAWSFTTLLAQDRRVYNSLAAAALRTLGDFNTQDLSNTVWAFASAGECCQPLMNGVAEEACRRRSEFGGQHLAMVAWAFTTMRHRHDQLFGVFGEIARALRLGSWHSAKLLAFSLAGLPRMGAVLGSREATLEILNMLNAMMLDKRHSGELDVDDTWVVHDAVFPWMHCEGGCPEIAASREWQEIDDLVGQQRKRLWSLIATPVFDLVIPTPTPVEFEVMKATMRKYQQTLQSLGIRGLGCAHTWLFLRDLGLRRICEWYEDQKAAASVQDAAHAEAPASAALEPGRGERQNWCFFRAEVAVEDADSKDCRTAVEPGRFLHSSVVNYREDCSGLVAVKLHHDRVDHRAWDAEFRALARTAAVARALLKSERSAADHFKGIPSERLEGDLICHWVPGEERVTGKLVLVMTEVPCLSCICAMVQFRRRFPNILMEVNWDGLPAGYA